MTDNGQTLHAAARAIQLGDIARPPVGGFDADETACIKRHLVSGAPVDQSRYIRECFMSNRKVQVMDTETTAQTETETENETKELTLDDVRKKVFGYAEYEGAMNYLAQFAHIENLSVERNFDAFEDIPEGYSVVVVPLASNVAGDDEKKRRVKSGIQCFAIPTVELLLESNNEHAIKYVNDRVQDALVAKAKSSVESEDGIPLTIGDFVRSGRGDGTLMVFNDMAPGVVKVLKARGFKHLDIKTLRRVLESKSFAEKEYPKVSQDTWVTILDRMIQKAAAEGDDGTFFEDCKANRDNKDFAETENIDLSDLEI